MGASEQIVVPVPPDGRDISSMIHVIRGEQVMLDSDLAALYQVETKNLNRAASRNAERFPEDFRFRLTADEWERLRCQNGTAISDAMRRNAPYAYTEQGISMLAGILRSPVAVRASVAIMRAFVAMRRFLADNARLLERVNTMEVRQLAYQERTDARIDEVFARLEGDVPHAEHIFFDGQIYDAFALLAEIVGSARESILLIDGYVDVATLNVLAKKRDGARVDVWTDRRCPLTDEDVSRFNAQYPTLELHHTRAFHDRFLVLDGKVTYHVGASIKDAGRRAFAITRMEDPGAAGDIARRLER